MTCPRCQELEILLHPQLRNSRFDFNARYIRFDEAQQIPEFQSSAKVISSEGYHYNPHTGLDNWLIVPAIKTKEKE